MTQHLVCDTSRADQHYVLSQEAAPLYDGDWRLAGFVLAAVSAEGTMSSASVTQVGHDTALSGRELQRRDLSAGI